MTKVFSVSIRSSICNTMTYSTSPRRRCCYPRLPRSTQSHWQRIAHQYRHCYLRYWMFLRRHLSLCYRRSSWQEEVCPAGYDYHEYRRHPSDRFVWCASDDCREVSAWIIRAASCIKRLHDHCRHRKWYQYVYRYDVDLTQVV